MPGMIVQTFGNLDHHELHLRWLVPFRMTRYVWPGGRWVMDVRRVLNPTSWLRSILNRGTWSLRWTFWREANHRCYCPVGIMFDGCLELAGWGVVWFWSTYNGPVPCSCDLVIREYFGDDD